MKADNPDLVAITYICHRLAFACIDTNTDFQYIKFAALLKAQTEVYQMTLSETTTKLVTRRMKKACQTRWLSFNSAIQSLYQELVAVVQTLNMLSSDPTSYGLRKK